MVITLLPAARNRTEEALRTPFCSVISGEKKSGRSFRVLSTDIES